MMTMIFVELQKIFRKWRTYIGFIAIMVMTLIVQVALYFTQDSFMEHSTRSLNENFIFQGNFFNGYSVAYIILNAMFIHIPFLVVLVGGDLFAGEATAGTYRMLLTRPVSRITLVTSKFISGFIYVLIFIVFLMAVSLVGSLAIFGSGELLVFKGKIIIHAANDIIWRFAFAYLYSAVSMITVISFSIFFSSLVNNAIGPIFTTMSLIIVFFILSAIPVDVLQDMRPYFFTSHLSQWDGFFADTIDMKEIMNSVLVLVGHTVILYALTAYFFIKKDILS